MDTILSFFSGGILNVSWWWIVGYTLVMTHITIVSVTIFLHRHQAHPALDLHSVVSHFFRFWLWLTTGMVTREWVAGHRKHHAKCETENDPHSPQVYGLRRVLCGGVELYRVAARDEETLIMYGRHTPDDFLERHVYTKYSKAGISILFVLDVMLFGVVGITVWAVQMMWIPIFAAGGINGVGHYYGYRSFETQDRSMNILPLGVIIGGEELHNNHHRYPHSAKLSYSWYEFDIGWLYICDLEAFGLARVNCIHDQRY